MESLPTHVSGSKYYASLRPISLLLHEVTGWERTLSVLLALRWRALAGLSVIACHAVAPRGRP